MLDRNKTELTIQVTSAVLNWLGERGFKPVATEVRVAAAWHADLAAVIQPTLTELTRLGLYPCSPGYQDLEQWKAWRDKARASVQRVMTCLVEVKTTRGDFLSDGKWKRIPPTDLAYLAVPQGVLTRGEYIDGWGILELRERGIRQLKAPTPLEVPLEQQRDTILAIAMRNHNVETYAHLRQITQEQRAAHAESRNKYSLIQLVQALQSVAEARYPLLDCFSSHGVDLKRIPSSYLDEFVTPLYGIARKEKVG